MGDRPTEPLRPQFDRRLRLEFHGAKVTSNAGLRADRELDNALDRTPSAAAERHDMRTGQNPRHRLTTRWRQSIDCRLAGSEDRNDAERRRVDPARRIAVGGRAWDPTAASTRASVRFETETLTTPTILNRLRDRSGPWIDRAHRHRTLTKIVLDSDRSVSATDGPQQGAASHGHFGGTGSHPRFVFDQVGDRERVMLRRRHHPSATCWRRVLRPVIARSRERKIPQFFRGEAAFAAPKLRKRLEAEGDWYTLRLKAHAGRERPIAHRRQRPVDRPAKKPTVFSPAFRSQAKSWDRARRVGAQGEWHAGERFPRVGFVVTNLRRSAQRVLRFSHGRGTAEQGIKEGKKPGSGPGCRAAGSRPTRGGCSCSPWPPTWPTSCGDGRCPGPCGLGR